MQTLKKAPQMELVLASHIGMISLSKNVGLIVKQIYCAFKLFLKSFLIATEPDVQ